MAESNDDKIIRLAAGTAGVVRRPDLVDAGVSTSAIDRRLASGAMKTVARRIYVVEALRQRATLRHVALAAHPDGALSRVTAARIHRFPTTEALVHVTTQKGRHTRLDGIKVHETRLWLSGDIISMDGFRVTSPERTLIDLTPSLRDAALRHLLETQFVAKTPSSEAFVAAFLAHARRGLNGTVRLRSMLDRLLDDQPFPESELERILLLGLAERGHGDLGRQFQPPWYAGRRGIVDMADPAGATIIEADGRRWHSTTQAQTDDRRRDRQALAAGYQVIRVGWQELTERREATLDDIVSVIERRRRSAVA